MNYGKSLSYVFEDPEWITKFLVGGLISLIPILNLVWIGFAVELTRNVILQLPRPLPEWDNFGEKFRHSLTVFIAQLIFSLPLLIMLGVVFIPVLVSAFTQDPDLQGILASAGGIGFVLLCCITFLYLLFLSVIYPAMLLNYIEYPSFSAFFQINRILGIIRRNTSMYLTTVLVAFAFSVIIGLVVGTVTGVLSAIPCIGWILGLLAPMITVPYTTSVMHHLYGQYGALTSGNPPAYATISA